jgi:RNA polymerase sigma-32 factor
MKQGLESLKPQEANLIGQQLKVSTKEVLEMEARFNGHEVALEPATNDEDDNNYTPIAYLASAVDNEPSCVLEQKQLEIQQSTCLTRAIASLDERSRRIIEARWLRENNTVTLHDLANEFGVSAERIRQIEQKAMAKMQVTMLSAS